MGIHCGHTAASQEHRHGVGLLAWLAGGKKEEENCNGSNPFHLFNTFVVASTKCVCVCICGGCRRDRNTEQWF